MQTINQEMSAGESRRFPCGKYFFLLYAPLGVDITFLGNNHQPVGSALGVKGGFNTSFLQTEKPLAMKITSLGDQVIKAQYSDIGEINYVRSQGDIDQVTEIVNPVDIQGISEPVDIQGISDPVALESYARTITNAVALASYARTITNAVELANYERTTIADESAYNNTMSQLCGFGAAYCAAASGLYSNVQLWNPSGSSRRLSIESVTLWCAGEMRIRTDIRSVELSTIADDTRNKYNNNSGLVGELKCETTASRVCADGFCNAIAGTPITVPFKNPIILNPGVGMGFTPNSTNNVIEVMYQWTEVPY